MAIATGIPPRVKPVTLLENGDVVQKIGEVSTTVARYDHEKKFLEFASADHKDNQQLYNQVIAALGTTENGKAVSGLAIRSIGVKGVSMDSPLGAAAPKRPKMGPNGDLTPAIVDWFFRYKPKEAIIRYKVFTDPSGNPVRKDIRRIITEIVDDRDGLLDIESENENRGRKVGKNKWENGPVQQTRKFVVLENMMIARRPTQMTGEPNEVIGGFDADDHDASEDGDEGGEE